MLNFDDVTNENKIANNPNRSYIPDHLMQNINNSGSGSRKTNSLLNLTNHQPDIHKIYLYAKDSYQVKYQFLINKRGKSRLKALWWYESLKRKLEWYARCLYKYCRIKSMKEMPTIKSFWCLDCWYDLEQKTWSNSYWTVCDRQKT